MLRHNSVFLQDGAACHRAALGYLQRKNIQMVEDYPARSPDFNMIETLWAKLQTDVWAKRPVTRDDLVKAIRASWDEMSDVYVASLLRCWTSRLDTAIARNGAQ